MKMDVETFEKILRECWSRETAYEKDRDKWTPGLPEVGQCFVTTLVVNDYFGGRAGSKASNKKSIVS